MPLTTGIKELDGVLGGGFVEGTVCAIVGPPGSGSGVFARRFATVGDEVSYYFTTNEGTDDVYSSLKRFGWSTDTTVVDIGDKYHDTVLMRRLEITKYRQRFVDRVFETTVVSTLPASSLIHVKVRQPNDF